MGWARAAVTAVGQVQSGCMKCVPNLDMHLMQGLGQVQDSWNAAATADPAHPFQIRQLLEFSIRYSEKCSQAKEDAILKTALVSNTSTY
jgi:hypothetical protein